MRINELKDKIDKLGQKYDEKFIVRKYEAFITIYVYRSDEYYNIASIMLEKQYTFNTIHEIFEDLPKELRKELFDILVEFARTPEDEREEVKKYQYRLKEKYWWIVEDINRTYLNWIIDEEGARPLTINDRYEADGVETSFTDKAIEEIAEKYDIDLDMFDKIEVEDE